MKATESITEKYDVISTGLSDLDRILGIGGIASKKIIECSGIWSVGKSTLAIQIVAQAQKEKKPCLWADAEFSWSNEYASKLGVDCNDLDLLQEQHAEAHLDGIEKWASEHKNGVIVIDAIGALLPKEEAEKSAEARVIGVQARLIGSFCRKIVPILALRNHTLLVLNHQFVDLMSGRLKTSGGAKLEHARSVWLSMRKLKPFTGGVIIEVEVRKNKLAPTEKQKAELRMEYGQGFTNTIAEQKKRGRPKK